MAVKDADGSTYFRGPGAGTAVYLTHLRAKSRDFIKGGDAIFLLTMEGNQAILKSIHAQYIQYVYIYIHTLSHLLVLLRRLSSSTQPASPDQHATSSIDKRYTHGPRCLQKRGVPERWGLRGGRGEAHLQVCA